MTEPAVDETEETSVRQVVGKIIDQPSRHVPRTPVDAVDSGDIEVDPAVFQRRRLERRLQRAREVIPARFRWARFGSDALGERVKPAGKAQLARRYAGRDMLLVGPSGAGKTSLACAVLAELIDQGAISLDQKADPWRYRRACRVGFVLAYDLARASMHTPYGKRPDLVSECVKASVLVIDDLGMDVDVYRASATSVREVIHERHAHNKPVVVTTYLSRDELIEHYGAGIGRRLCSGMVMQLGG